MRFQYTLTQISGAPLALTCIMCSSLELRVLDDVEGPVGGAVERGLGGWLIVREA